MDFHISLEGRRQVSKQIYRQIREAILDGRLRAGGALPSSRELARRLAVSRNTVVVAFEQLHAEGFLVTRVGAGTFVSEDIRQRPQGGRATSPLQPRSVWNEIPEVTAGSSGTDYDFRPGIPDTGEFPIASWRARLNRQYRRHIAGTEAQSGTAGHTGLRRAIAHHTGLTRAVHATADDVFITNGTQQAINLIADILLEPGDRVAVEDPGYPLPMRAFHAHGCRVSGVPVDDEGLVVDAIPAGTRLVYVTPSHQFPLGMTMSMARRQALLEWAERADAAIIEDDYDSEFRYAGRPLESLHSLDASGRVLYVGTFSKVLLPITRLGFAIVPAPLHAAFRKAKSVADLHTEVTVQAAAAQFIEDGHLVRHIKRMRKIYASRHDRILRVLARDFGDTLVPIPSICGLHLTALLHDSVQVPDVAIVSRAAGAGVALDALSPLYIDAPARHGLLFGYGAIPTERIEDGLRKLSLHEA